ncbi:hypothetical protein JXB01_03860 [Candidatus Micrarchaeota archaeon]|nr:hypothetical protein [Candidatus Micrarchaeota archaeon]
MQYFSLFGSSGKEERKRKKPNNHFFISLPLFSRELGERFINLIFLSAFGDLMKKGMIYLMAILLLFGFAFAAVDNPDVTETAKWDGYTYSASDSDFTTEGGNTSQVDINVNQSTERWAGVFGNLSNSFLVLSNDSGSISYYLYKWTYVLQDNSQICVSTNAAATWAALTAATAVNINTDWAFGSVSDNATNTYNETANFNLFGTALASTASAPHQSSSTYTSYAVNVVAGAGSQDNYAFCTNMTVAGTNYRGEGYNYELILPTDYGVGAGPVETYTVYVELH